MPLIKSGSESAFKTNVGTLMGEIGKSPHVKDRSQALAIAYATKRRGSHKKHGGKVKGYDTGGATDPVTAVISALQSGSNQVASPGSNPGMNQSAPTQASAAQAPAGVTTPTPLPTNTGLGTSNPIAQTIAPNNVALAPQGVTAGLAPQTQVQNGIGGKPLGMAFGGMPGAGVGQMPWYVRSEARSLGHTGPIMSAVPGRTDRHPLNVPSGAYVLPADHVSSLGQGNTQAGMHILNRMFGTPGKMPMGGGAPKPPRVMGIPGDKGGARGDATGKSVPVIVAGGEYIIDPSIVARIGGGSVKTGHAILDKWVISNRKKHVSTLKKLPGPAKA